ncbi:MAG: MerR family transcriptional regulator [Oscillospiraceae bacterium]|nr:MerR family transcriptional regulator [Oscillospiraceae bacterium]
MNVREIEQQLGIPRANVRYYEKEGLLHPRRGSNNYRVYTVEDVEELKKIRLLRQLDMPIETIRAVQAGEVPLADAVARQEQLLENEAVKLGQARAACRSLLADGVTYAALEPARYENVRPVLPGRQQAEPEEPKRPPVEGAEWAFHPWQRFWARSLDLALANAAAVIFLALVFHISVLNTGTRLISLLSTVLGWGVVLAVEPLLLRTWGTTPGKWLLGLELRTSRGEKLRCREGFERTWGVLLQGYGLSLPIYSLYRQYKGYRRCEECEPMEYDQHGGFQYYSLSSNWLGVREAVSAALSLALIVPGFLASCQVLLPPNRGDVTPAELAENINTLANRQNYSLWVDGEGYELAAQTVNVQEDGGPWVEYVCGQPFSDTPVYTVETDENGFVTAVIFEETGDFSDGDPGAVWLPVSRVSLVLQSFAGASGSGLALARSPLLQDLASAGTVSASGFTRTVGLEMEGYQDGSGGLLWSEEDAESGWYRYTVRVEKTS